MKLIMKPLKDIKEKDNKRIIIGSLFVAILVLMFTLIHTVYAGNLSISLNSPVSFPVDI